jgi:diaminopimelate epimerase
MIKFTKMHGAGNDYVYVDATKKMPGGDLNALARAVADRRTGIGSDGLILIAPSQKADFRMIMFNSDGSEGAMCGNGIRCIAKYVYDRGLTRKTNMAIETPAGVVGIEVVPKDGIVHEATVAMGAPRPVPATFHVSADGQRTILPVQVTADDRTFDATVVSMGNPHCVIEVDDVDAFPVPQYGPLIERHSDFPSRVNVEFVEVVGRGHVKQRTWERGSGETFACGSGACAVGAALHANGRTDPTVRIDLRGGTLTIRVDPAGGIHMTGPAVEIFQGEWPE